MSSKTKIKSVARTLKPKTPEERVRILGLLYHGYTAEDILNEAKALQDSKNMMNLVGVGDVCINNDFDRYVVLSRDRLIARIEWVDLPYEDQTVPITNIVSGDVVPNIKYKLPTVLPKHVDFTPKGKWIPNYVGRYSIEPDGSVWSYMELNPHNPKKMEILDQNRALYSRLRSASGEEKWVCVSKVLKILYAPR